jgi:cytochrome c
MLKLDRKLIISASLAAAVALSVAGCLGSLSPSSGSNANAKASIDGGVYYPIENGKTSVYLVNEDTLKGGYTNGRTPTANELAAWDTDVMPDGTGLPEGEGSVSDGSDIYDAKCVSCHGDFGSGGGGYPSLSKGNAVKLQKTLKNQRDKPDAEGPVRVFGSYWPKASTLWWYIKDGMPHPTPSSLTDDETYALVAYILNINEMSIDGKLVDDDYVLNREEFLKIKMPNENGFEPNIDGPDSLKGVRAYYANAQNFGAQNLNQGAVRCMTDCQKPTAKTVYIQHGGISDFKPPMATARDLPVVEKTLDVGAENKKIYEDNCKMCHGQDGMGAPVFGDKPAWAKVTDRGMKSVYKNAIDGINGMPPKGGTDLSDTKFKSIVDYIINNSK